MPNCFSISATWPTTCMIKSSVESDWIPPLVGDQAMVAVSSRRFFSTRHDSHRSAVSELGQIAENRFFGPGDFIPPAARLDPRDLGPYTIADARLQAALHRLAGLQQVTTRLVPGLMNGRVRQAADVDTLDDDLRVRVHTGEHLAVGVRQVYFST